MSNKSTLNVNEIMDLLPHRHPFLLIDRVLEVTPGESILAFKNISILGFITSKQKATDGKLYLFAGVDKARFKRPVVPGDQLMITSKIEAVKRNIWKFGCSATVDGKKVCDATLLCAYQDRDSVA